MNSSGRGLAATLALALLAACGSGPTERPAAHSASVDPQQRPFWRTVVMGTSGMVAAEHPLAALAGLRMLQQGGNAFDAAAAVFYMTTVVEQHQAGIGGDGFILAYLAKENRVIFLNGTGPAPQLATREFYEKHGGIPDAGPLSTSVPGALGAFELALRKYGSLDTAAVIEPAIEAATEGHGVSYWSASMHASAAKKIAPFGYSMKLLMPNGSPMKPGELFVQTDLAKTLKVIASGGAEEFYRGAIARQIGSFYEAQGGLLRYDDLAAYQPEEAEPIKTTFHGLEVYQSAPNSQGIVMLMALNILEGMDLTRPGHNTPEYLHAVSEALKLAFADRDRYIADPRFAKDMPVAELLSKEYGESRRALIRADSAIKGAAPPGDPRAKKSVLDGLEIAYESGPQPVDDTSAARKEGETSSFSVADRFGNLVSVTHSVNATFGSGMYVEGGGFVLNDRMPYFSLSADDVNALVPGKRPRHTVNPALALKDGKPYLAWNTPGGDNQPQAMLQAFLNVAVFGMNVQQAVEAPTVTTSSFHASMYPQEVGGKLTVPQVLAESVAAALAAKGHAVRIVRMQQPYNQQPSGAGAVKMLMIDPETGVMHGGVSPAKDNYVMGW